MLTYINDGVTWTSDNWKCMIWSDHSSFTLFPTSGRVYVWRTPKEVYKLECLVPKVKYKERSVMVWAAISYSIGPIITLHGRITVREHMGRLGNQVHPMIETFLNNSAVFQDNNAPFTELELFSHGLKSMKVNFNIFPGQHNHQI
jgi:hypothetical protein